jgi:hypothetical protein
LSLTSGVGVLEEDTASQAVAKAARTMVGGPFISTPILQRGVKCKIQNAKCKHHLVGAKNRLHFEFCILHFFIQ